MACSKFFSFAEIVKGGAQGIDPLVRLTDDNMIYAVDLVMVISGKNRNDASQALRNIPEEIFPSSKFIERQLSTKGGHKTKLVKLEDALLLVMVLPGKIAKETRSKFADIIRRYLGGDKSLITEIEANAASDSPIAQLARASVDAVQTVISPEEIIERKRRREIEDAELQSKKLGNVKLFADTMSLINPHWSNDARLRMQTEDWLKNVAFNSQLALTNGVSGSDEFKSITIGEVANSFQKRLDHSQSIKAGVLVAKKYQEKNGLKPPKQRRWVDNAEREICAYTEKDRGIIVEALKELGIV